MFQRKKAAKKVEPKFWHAPAGLLHDDDDDDDKVVVYVMVTR